MGGRAGRDTVSVGKESGDLLCGAGRDGGLQIGKWPLRAGCGLDVLIQRLHGAGMRLALAQGPLIRTASG